MNDYRNGLDPEEAVELARDLGQTEDMLRELQYQIDVLRRENAAQSLMIDELKVVAAQPCCGNCVVPEPALVEELIDAVRYWRENLPTGYRSGSDRVQAMIMAIDAVTR